MDLRPFCFSDGDVMGAVLDRNGLRPSRYYITSDGYMILSSEVGVMPVPEDKIVLKERLHPGKMLLVDTVQGKVIDDDELKEKYANMQPYGEWLNSNLVQLKDIKIPNIRMEEYTDEQRARLQKAFGYTYEQYRTSIRNMALNGAESIGAMGVDTPLAVLSDQDARYLIISNSFLHRLQTRQSMRSVKKLLLLPVYMSVKTETFWYSSRRTVMY